MGTIRTQRLSRAERIILETFAPLLRDIHRRSHILHEVISTLEHFRGVRTLAERVVFQFGTCSFLCRTAKFYIIHI